MGATEEGLRKWQTGKTLLNAKYLFAMAENYTAPDGRKVNIHWLSTGDAESYI